MEPSADRPTTEAGDPARWHRVDPDPRRAARPRVLAGGLGSGRRHGRLARSNLVVSVVETGTRPYVHRMAFRCDPGQRATVEAVALAHALVDADLHTGVRALPERSGDLKSMLSERGPCAADRP